MKNRILLLLISGAISLSLSAKDNYKAQRVVRDEYGNISIGTIVPDHGMADPHVWIENETLYMMCGHDQTWDHITTWNIDRWELWSSKDLLNWKLEYKILPTQTYIGDLPNCWAGDLCERDGKYYWFFSNRNINTGVMVADKITGPYRDLLGKPLLEKGLVKEHVYDPEIFVENGEYHICFGARFYHMAPLAKDMKSITATPKRIDIIRNGNKVGASDKSSLFKRKEWYYLVYGSTYAMSKNLYGPYNYIGDFGDGQSNHNSFFEWKGQWYMVQEMTETTPFFRGVNMQPIYFNEDGTFYLPKKRSYYPGYGKDYSFNHSIMGWSAEDGTSLVWNKKRGYIQGEISQGKATIVSPIFLWSDLRKNKTVSLTITNKTSATMLRIGIASLPDVRGPWGKFSKIVKDSNCIFIEVPIKKGKQSISVPLSEFKGLDARLMQLRVEPATDATTGEWKIDDIVLRGD